MGGYGCVSDCLDEGTGNGRLDETNWDLHLKVIG
jgi:hypothetical protein